MEDNQENKKSPEADEIDLIEVFKKIWEGRKTIYKSVAVCFVIGIIVIIGSPNEYKSEVVLLEESASKSSSLGGLASLAGLAGISGLGGSSTGAEGLAPALYPDIVKSTPFLLEVAKQKVALLKNDSIVSVIGYFDRYSKPSFTQKLVKYTVGLPGTIIGAIKGKPKVSEKPKYSFSLSLEEDKAVGELSKRIKVKDGESAGTIVISVEMQDPLAAAQLTDSVVKSLTKYAVDYRTQKAKKDLEFIEQRFAEAKEKYINAQQTLAYYRDQNKNVILASTKTEEERLQSEFNLASSVYTSLAQQFEQAKIKVQEDTPVFNVIEPTKMGQKSKPNIGIMVLAFVFIGGFCGISIIISKLIFAKDKL